jgi:class 3 adenylate cyclase
MIGLIAASLSFFLVEDYARKTLVPVVFPRGRLAGVPGTLRIPILRRIRLLYGAGTLNPMIILIGTFAFTAWQVKGTQIPIEDFLREIFFFTLVLCTIFVVISLKLNLLVQKSIQKPLGEMLGILGKVRRGDFTPRIRVFANDEIGVLGDAGNAMLAGLQEMERIRDTFGKVVTPEIRDQILAGRIPVTGQRTEATLLFSDLRGFTTYVEENPPEEVISSMRTYFTAMERAIRNHDGLVLQYVGDEIEAVFGVPLRYDDHQDKAVMAALEMRKNLEALNTNRLEEGKEPFRHGIGIHTGLVLAGNTGSEDRLSYALVGDTVNVASRIEGLTKKMECDILVSEDTVRRFTNTFEMKEAGSETLKGYSKPVTVYRVS